MQPSELSFSERPSFTERIVKGIKRHWRTFERYVPFALVALAFTLRFAGLFINDPSALNQIAAASLSLGLFFLFALIFEIHTKIFDEGRRKHWDFTDLETIILGHLRASRGQRNIRIRLIGLSLENQWRPVKKFLSELPEANVLIEVVHLNPNWDALDHNARDTANGILSAIASLRRDYSDYLQENGPWKIELYPISEFPIVAGFMLGDGKLWRTTCDIGAQSKKIKQGDTLYEFFDDEDFGDAFGHRMIEHFNDVFLYYKNLTINPGNFESDVEAR